MFSSVLLNRFITREGEAPAEPLRYWLGRSLARPNAVRPSGCMLALQLNYPAYLESIYPFLLKLGWGSAQRMCTD